jgi:uncharacterized repeat protein (TIGR03803 family)
MVFSLNTNGGGFSDLHSFNSPPADGYLPLEGVLLLGKTLYGTTEYGGTNNYGTVYGINIDGSGYAVLHSFNNSDGANPWAKLIAVGNTLYGVAYGGGASGDGSIFSINSDGTGYTTIYNFTGSPDGANPRSALVSDGTKLYGTAAGGGANGHGTVFSVNLDGTGFLVLHTFTGGDGALPWSQLNLAGSTLYGTANSGGAIGYGTLFSLNVNGTYFTKYYDFANSTSSIGFPQAGVLLVGNTLAGTGVWGGTNSSGGGGIYTYTLPAPTVNLTAVGQQNFLYWPNSAVNYTLQTATNLASTNWVAATNQLPVTGVLVTNQQPSQFFRLQLAQ